MAAFNQIADTFVVLVARPTMQLGRASPQATVGCKPQNNPNSWHLQIGLSSPAGVANLYKPRCNNNMIIIRRQTTPPTGEDMSPTPSTPSSTSPSNNDNDNEESTKDGAPRNLPPILLLPPELIIHIFSLLSLLSPLPSLIRTAKPFARIWQHNALSIARTLLAGYFDPALELVRLQSPHHSSLPRNHGTPGNAPAHAVTTQIVARMFANERLVSDASARFGAQLVGCGILSPPPLGKGCFSEVQRERFHAAYYRYWIEGFDEAEEAGGGLRHEDLDLRTLFVREVVLRRRRGRERAREVG